MKKLIIPPVFVLISLASIVAFYFAIPHYNVILYPYNFSGVLISFAGFVIMGKARDLFKKHATTLAITESSFMVTEGIYSKTRNPMYGGMFLLLLGLAICFRNLFSILTPFVFLIIIQILFIPREEKLMLKQFGEQYLLYKQKVRRWL